MFSIIKEIIDTPIVILENNINFDDNNFLLKFPRFRRTHTMACLYCKSRWGDIHYDEISRNRVCIRCKNNISDGVIKRRRYLKLVSETLQNKNKVLEDIIEVGMHPDRVYQTQLVENLGLFRQPSK